MYLSTLMLTGQGGPEGELPWYTKGVVLLTGIFSIGMFAIPASMLTWGFEAEAHRLAKRSYQQQQQQQQQQHSTAGQRNDSDSWSSADDDYSTDEEYVKIISGKGENVEDGNDKAIMDEATKAAIAKFLEVDEDGSGSISLEEFLQYVHESTLTVTQERPGGGEVTGHDLRSIAKGMPITALAVAGPDTKELQKRIGALEAKLDHVLVKVDRLCHLLETQCN
jgi:hypothetical protein